VSLIGIWCVVFGVSGIKVLILENVYAFALVYVSVR